MDLNAHHSFISLAAVRGWLSRKRFNSMQRQKELVDVTTKSKRKGGRRVSEDKVLTIKRKIVHF